MVQGPQHPHLRPTKGDERNGYNRYRDWVRKTDAEGKVKATTKYAPYGEHKPKVVPKNRQLPTKAQVDKSLGRRKINADTPAEAENRARRRKAVNRYQRRPTIAVGTSRRNPSGITPKSKRPSKAKTAAKRNR